MGQHVTLFVSAFSTLLAIVNPLAAPPAFLKLTDGKSNATLAAAIVLTMAETFSRPRLCEGVDWLDRTARRRRRDAHRRFFGAAGAAA